MAKNKLPDDVAEKYNSTIEPGWIVTKHPDRQRIDLRNISLQKADDLVQKGVLDKILIAKKSAKKKQENKED